jgi:hypothetical protein
MTRWFLTAAAIGTITGVALTFGPHAAIGIAVCAAGVIAWFGVVAARADRRARDKARRPRIRYWTADWQEISAPPNGTIIFKHESQDRSGLDCGRCGRPQFFSHKCIDGEWVRGAIDGLVP